MIRPTSLRTTGRPSLMLLVFFKDPSRNLRFMLKNVKAATFKPRPCVPLGVALEEPYLHSKLVTTHVYQGVRVPCVSVFRCDLCTLCRSVSAGLSWVCRGLLESVGFWQFVLSLCSLSSVFSCFSCPFRLCPVFGVWFRQMLSSGLSCLQYALPMTVSPKMALTFTTGLYRPFLAPLLLSLCRCLETLQKCFFCMLSVYIYSQKI